MSDLHGLLEQLSLGDHVGKFDGLSLEGLVALDDDQLGKLLEEQLNLPAAACDNLRKAVEDLRKGGGDRGGGGGADAPPPARKPGKASDQHRDLRAASAVQDQSFAPTMALLCVVSAAVVSLLAACEDLAHLCPNVMFYARESLELAKRKLKTVPFLSLDEAGAVVLYTVEFEEKEDSVYHQANAALRSKERGTLVQPFAKYLRLLDNALTKLREHDEAQHGGPRARTVWRGIKANLDAQFTKGEPAMFWGLTSCTHNSEVLKNNAFLGQQGHRTLLSVTTSKATSVAALSFFPDEDELLLPLGTRFEVTGKLDLGSDLLMVELREDGLVDGALQPTPAAPQPGNAENDAIQRGHDQYIHHQHAAALATFRACQDSSVALGFQAVVLWLGGGGVKKDAKAAKNAATAAVGGGGLQDEATKGNPHAQFVLGVLHYHGVGVDENEVRAASLLADAAGQGNAAAQHYLGICYLCGKGVDHDYGKAVEVLAEAANQGHAGAQRSLGNCYNNGWGVDRDAGQAKHYFRLAAAQGNDGGTKKSGKGCVVL